MKSPTGTSPQQASAIERRPARHPSTASRARGSGADSAPSRGRSGQPHAKARPPVLAPGGKGRRDPRKALRRIRGKAAGPTQSSAPAWGCSSEQPHAEAHPPAPLVIAGGGATETGGPEHGQRDTPPPRWFVEKPPQGATMRKPSQSAYVGGRAAPPDVAAARQAPPGRHRRPGCHRVSAVNQPRNVPNPLPSTLGPRRRSSEPRRGGPQPPPGGSRLHRRSRRSSRAAAGCTAVGHRAPAAGASQGQLQPGELQIRAQGRWIRHWEVRIR